ncbi:MAG: DNA-3-methyladenine glycosylase 2 family protein [Spirochaetaceae bacterium]|nr:MAG: DNA-3-methyladenine glycosylase 2 family protein [Spirochaetaceae bacterium]
MKSDRTATEPPYWDEACRILTDRDPTIGHLIETHRSDVLRGSGDAFQTLLNAIVGQQISVAAAAGIWQRLRTAFPRLTPASIVAADAAQLRSIGLSYRKVEYVHGVARAFIDGAVDAAAWASMDDDSVRDELIALRGIGPWTAEMVLIFHLQRPDVLPLGDIGLVNAAARLYGWTDGSPKERLLRHAERWRPWRTVATWYIWRDLDAEPVVY